MSEDIYRIESTTIEQVNSQMEFVLTNGPANDDAFNDMGALVTGGVELAVACITDYNGATKTITLAQTLPFTVSAHDLIDIHLDSSVCQLQNSWQIPTYEPPPEPPPEPSRFEFGTDHVIAMIVLIVVLGFLAITRERNEEAYGKSDT